ncbi:MAG: alcohol dehydrogenase catalytic domain-containing protein [Phycisphaerales bacterium]|nr:MAG: alcohol dehydrogenase catalytic domain-containing protein [Phycisphaerales bacterium]
MKALEYRKSIPRYALLKLLGSRFPSLYTSALAPVALRDLPEPKLPNEHWVRIRPRLAGICGSDLATVCAKGSPYLAPVTSMPFVLGHELVGHVTEVGDAVEDISVGDRVVLHPALGCKVRGIEPLCDACADGRDPLCRNVTRGDIAAGIQTGYCRDTGGAFSSSLVAHQSQVYQVPSGVSDGAAVLIEPFSCALHGALRVSLAETDTVLVIGCGTIGLLTIAALRATGCKARIVAAAMFDHQKEHALRLGADELVDTHGPLESRYAQWARALDAEVLRAELGKPTVIGGANVVFDCVAASSTIDNSIRFTKAAGTLVLVGMPGIPRGVDWTPLWYKELTVCAAYAYGPERLADGKRETFDLAIELIQGLDTILAPLTGSSYRLEDYPAAIAAALDHGRSKAVKTIFAIDT